MFSINNKENSNIMFVFENTDYNDEFLSNLQSKEIFKGEFKETFFQLKDDGSFILYVGLGEKKDLTKNKIREVSYLIGKELNKNKIKKAEVKLEDINSISAPEQVNLFVEGVINSTYSFDKYLSEDKKNDNFIEHISINLPSDSIEESEHILKETLNIMSGVNLTRDLVNERAINMYPEILANIAKEELEPLGINVKVYNEEEIKDLGMEAFLAVAEGSSKEPKFIVMEYIGNSDSDEKIALVGKGLTYDSGGYSLKPSNSMDTMYTDMAGSATVIGALKAISKSNLKANVVGIVAACENLISGKAYKPGDIIGSMSGKTIEVLNTDAEGRLTLADALWYAKDVVKANKIIDLATLTGACVVALGDIATGAITNNKELMEEIIEASDFSGEYIWELPNYKEFREYFKSDFADIANTNTKGVGAGTITAGQFLENFVGDTPWVHLDIAGTAYRSSAKSYIPKGATGIHVKTLYNYIKNI